ncbi:MAG: hypothetical protein JO147_09745, partial [Actinobacteria bacterium]|nr:hypothetical protein [Actinomycetota bacterium]
FKAEGIASVSGSENAWHGFFGWFAVLLVLIAGGLIAVELFAPQTKLPFPVRLTALGLYVLALICVILALVVFPEDIPSGFGISTGRGIGYWVDLILIAAGAVLCFLRLKATGGRLPWEKGPGTGGHGYPPAGGGYPPAGGGGYPPAGGGYPPPPGGGGYTPPPPPGYGPQQ